MRNAPTWGRASRTLSTTHRMSGAGRPTWWCAAAWPRPATRSTSREPRASTISAMDIAVGFNMMRELCGALPDEVLLSRSPPADVHPYRGFFRVPVRFDAEQSALVFPAGQLERPVPGADSRQREILEESVAKYWAVALPNVTDQVVRFSAPASCSAMRRWTRSRTLTMHPRTLNRRLQAEGTTFRKLLNETRFEVARQLLLAPA